MSPNVVGLNVGFSVSFCRFEGIGFSVYLGLKVGFSVSLRTF